MSTPNSTPLTEHKMVLTERDTVRWPSLSSDPLTLDTLGMPLSTPCSYKTSFSQVFGRTQNVLPWSPSDASGDFYSPVGGKGAQRHPQKLPLDFSDFLSSVGGTTDRNSSPWPSTTVTICLSCFRIGGLIKEHETNKPLSIRRTQEWSEAKRRCQSTCPTNLPESCLLESTLAEQCSHH